MWAYFLNFELWKFTTSQEYWVYFAKNANLTKNAENTEIVGKKEIIVVCWELYYHIKGFILKMGPRTHRRVVQVELCVYILCLGKDMCWILYGRNQKQK